MGANLVDIPVFECMFLERVLIPESCDWADKCYRWVPSVVLGRFI